MIPLINPTTRLSMSKDYIRPAKTATDKLQNKEELKKYLSDYVEVPNDDVNYLPMGQLLRYITLDKNTGREAFRFGGLLKKVDRNYLVLQGKNGLTFSCQRYTLDNNGNVVHTTRFFKKQNPELRIKREYEEALDESEELLQKQNKVIEKQKKELDLLKKKLLDFEKKSKK